MTKIEIVKSWYVDEVLSDDEAQAIYDNLLSFYMTLYEAEKKETI